MVRHWQNCCNYKKSRNANALRDFALFCFFTEDLGTEKKNIHSDKEDDKNDPSQHRLLRCQRGKEHHREAKDNGGEVLIDHIIGGGGLKLSVDLP